jgi:predicted amidohydrolase YtcJ
MFADMRKAGVKSLAGSDLPITQGNPIADISNTRHVAAAILGSRLIRAEDLQSVR